MAVVFVAMVMIGFQAVEPFAQRGGQRSQTLDVITQPADFVGCAAGFADRTDDFAASAA